MLIACLIALIAAPVPEGAKWVTLKGQVVWPADKPLPEAKEINLANAPDGAYALRGGPIFDEPFRVHGTTRGIKDIIVWIRPDNDKLNPQAPFPKDAIHPDLVKPKPVTHTITTEYCRYDRRGLAARVGDTIEFVNTGHVADNVKFNSTDNEMFNVLLPPERSHASMPLKAERLPVWYQSNIHPWMKGHARVFDHPYYAITDDKGRFEIKNVPAGKWRIVYWSERGWHLGRDGNRGLPLDVKGGPTLTLAPVEFVPPEEK